MWEERVGGRGGGGGRDRSKKNQAFSSLQVCAPACSPEAKPRLTAEIARAMGYVSECIYC